MVSGFPVAIETTMRAEQSFSCWPFKAACGIDLYGRKTTIRTIHGAFLFLDFGVIRR
jgi:hypothetical protein